MKWCADEWSLTRARAWHDVSVAAFTDQQSGSATLVQQGSRARGVADRALAGERARERGSRRAVVTACTCPSLVLLPSRRHGRRAGARRSRLPTSSTFSPINVIIIFFFMFMMGIIIIIIIIDVSVVSHHHIIITSSSSSHAHTLSHARTHRTASTASTRLRAPPCRPSPSRRHDGPTR
jgi:hypothetical protein